MERQQAMADYAAAWTGRDAETIAASLTRCWTEDSTYTDTATDTITGVDDLVRLVLATADRYPGFTLHPTSGLDTHHGVGRFSWLMTAPDPIEAAGVDYGRALPGLDFVEFTPDNRIARVVGFFG